MWTWDNNYRNLAQVEPFYPAYLAVRELILAAGGYPYNDLFKGRIPGLEDSPREDTAIYMLQTLRSVREMETQIAERRKAGWRDFAPDDLAGDTPVRFAAVAQYGWYVGETGFRQWENARLARYGTSVMILPGRSRTKGYLADGRLLVLPLA
jgi:hypothetical protein